MFLSSPRAASRILPLIGAAGVVLIAGFAPAKGAKSPKALAAAASHYYRDSIDTIGAPPPVFANEASPVAAKVGGVYKVDRDPAGRVVRSSRLVDGVVQGATAYVYEGQAKAPTRTVSYVDGVETGYRKISRDAQGRDSRYDYFTTDDVLTGYTLVAYKPDHVDYVTYSSDNQVTSRTEEYFNAAGHETRTVVHGPDGVRVTDSSYDPNSGSVTAQSVTENGKFFQKVSYTYDANDELIRKDAFNADGKPYAYQVYSHGLHLRSHYDLDNGAKKDIAVAHDQHRWISGSKLSINGKLLCTFTVERKSDGSVIRSVATGADGSLWAEYPKLMVIDVEYTGRAIGAPTVGVIHHTGDWY